jgi:hypothetical protein
MIFLLTDFYLSFAMARKIKTMERDFWFNLNPAVEATVNDDYYIDLAQCASLVNRVSLRQGMEYVVESVTVVTNGACNIGVFRLPEHWSAINAWEKAYHIWRESQQQVLDSEPTIAAKYRDFKVLFDYAHTASNNLIPCGYEIARGVTSLYDWEYSEIQIPNDPVSGTTTGFPLFMIGDNTASAKAIIKGYADSRSRPIQEEPNVPGEISWMTSAFDVGENLPAIAGDLRYENESPPYLIGQDHNIQTNYPGGEWQGIQPWTTGGMNPSGGTLENIMSLRSGTSGMAIQSSPGFVAPLGLLKITVDASGLIESPSGPYVEGILPSLLLKVTMAPGGYKGLLAQGMREAN